MSNFDDYVARNKQQQAQQVAEKKQKLATVEKILARCMDDLAKSKTMRDGGATFEGSEGGSRTIRMAGKVVTIHPTPAGIQVDGTDISIRSGTPTEFNRVSDELSAALVKSFKL